MGTRVLPQRVLETILRAQRNKITEHFIYKRLSGLVKGGENKKVLRDISDDELRHYNIWRGYSKRDVPPNGFKVWLYCLLARIFGVTFGIKLMESGESEAQDVYDRLARYVRDAERIRVEEEVHEHELIALIDEERLKYVGSMVLGLNDALVELTGALAGFTLVLQETRVIALAGLVTGIAASLSMAASEYLSSKTDKREGKDPFRASVYTGISYLVTVLFLVFPFFVLSDVYLCLGWTLFNAVFVVLVFTFYTSVAKDMPFKSRFFEMVAVSLGVALLTFCIGFVIRLFLGLEV